MKIIFLLINYMVEIVYFIFFYYMLVEVYLEVLNNEEVDIVDIGEIYN